MESNGTAPDRQARAAGPAPGACDVPQARSPAGRL